MLTNWTYNFSNLVSNKNYDFSNSQLNIKKKYYNDS